MEADRLRRDGWTWRAITERLDPKFANNPKTAIEAVRQGVLRLRKSQNKN